MRKCRYLIGIDEVGRGPLAGPVTVGAFCIDTHNISVKKVVTLLNMQLKKGVKKGVKKYTRLTIFDSKSISVKARESISKSITELVKKTNMKSGMTDMDQDMYVSIKSKTAKQIDTKGIAVCIRDLVAEVIVDICDQIGGDTCETEIAIFLDGGLKAPAQYPYQETIIKGDMKEPLIGIASVLAKVQRDRCMKKMAKKYPAYGFEKHKGYGTKRHMKTIHKMGITALHRKTYLRRMIALLETINYV